MSPAQVRPSDEEEITALLASYVDTFTRGDAEFQSY
jgi:hypothetical protein